MLRTNWAISSYPYCRIFYARNTIFQALRERSSYVVSPMVCGRIYCTSFKIFVVTFVFPRYFFSFWLFNTDCLSSIIVTVLGFWSTTAGIVLSMNNAQEVQHKAEISGITPRRACAAAMEHLEGSWAIFTFMLVGRKVIWFDTTLTSNENVLYVEWWLVSLLKPLFSEHRKLPLAVAI